MKNQQSPGNMIAQHTPGPLMISKQYRSEEVMQPEMWDVCTSKKDGTDTILETVAENCNEADAHLFAAAPDLLAALERALETIQGQAELLRFCGAAYGIGATLAQAGDAIAKATNNPLCR